MLWLGRCSCSTDYYYWTWLLDWGFHQYLRILWILTWGTDTGSWIWKKKVVQSWETLSSPLWAQLCELQDQHSNFPWAAKGTYKTIWQRCTWQLKLTAPIGTNNHTLSTWLRGDSHLIISVPQAPSLYIFSPQALLPFLSEMAYDMFSKTSVVHFRSALKPAASITDLREGLWTHLFNFSSCTLWSNKNEHLILLILPCCPMDIHTERAVVSGWIRKNVHL